MGRYDHLLEADAACRLSAAHRVAVSFQERATELRHEAELLNATVITTENNAAIVRRVEVLRAEAKVNDANALAVLGALRGGARPDPTQRSAS